MFPKCGHTRILPGAATETYIDHDSPSRPQVTRCHAGPVEVAVTDGQGVDFRSRGEDPERPRGRRRDAGALEAIKADEAFRQAMLAAIAAGQECAPTAVSTVVGTKVRSSFVASNEGSDC